MGRPLGQHFLFQRSILERIAQAACPDDTPLCIEIGPGPGGLTDSLLPLCERLIAVELDPNLATLLAGRHAGDPRLEVIQGDVLAQDLTQWGPAVVCGNLPYYITSPIIERVLAMGPSLTRAVFLVQKEVADRLAAPHNSRDYGYLSVATQLFCRVEKLFVVKPAAFQPPPKVDSAVVRLTPRETPLVADAAGFLKFASACFRQKRKTLRNNLGVLYPKPVVDALEQGGLRAEQLSLQALVQLFEKMTT